MSSRSSSTCDSSCRAISSLTPLSSFFLLGRLQHQGFRCQPRGWSQDVRHTSTYPQSLYRAREADLLVFPSATSTLRLSCVFLPPCSSSIDHRLTSTSTMASYVFRSRPRSTTSVSSPLVTLRLSGASSFSLSPLSPDSPLRPYQSLTSLTTFFFSQARS